MPEFTLLGQPVSPVEMLAFATGLLSVWFVLKLNVLTWPTGLLSVGCYAFVFAQARLYADAVLQGAFAVVGLYGWRQWRRSGPAGPSALRVLADGPRDRWLALAAGAAVAAAVAGALARWTDSPAPLADAGVFSFSLVATWLQARRRVEGWWYWIAVDVLSVPLYWSRALHLTALLYVVFLVMAVMGLRAWTARLRMQQA